MATQEEVADAFFTQMSLHDDHIWERIGPCVYCDDCKVRLYQGRIPDSHTKVRVHSYWDASDPKATKTMRERWGK